MMRGILILAGSLLLGCTSGASVSDGELPIYLKQSAYVCMDRFALRSVAQENLMKLSQDKGLFTAGVERDGNLYWLWVRTAMGEGKPPSEEILKFNGNSLVLADSDIKMGYSGRGLIRQPETVLESWYDVSLGYKIETDQSKQYLNRFKLHNFPKETAFTPDLNKPELKVQQAVFTNLLPRFVAFHPAFKKYEIALYRSKNEVYLLECWSDGGGDWYVGHRFDKSLGRDGSFVPDSKIRFDGERLSRGFWQTAGPWMRIVKWEK